MFGKRNKCTLITADQADRILVLLRAAGEDRIRFRSRSAPSRIAYLADAIKDARCTRLADALREREGLARAAAPGSGMGRVVVPLLDDELNVIKDVRNDLRFFSRLCPSPERAALWASADDLYGELPELGASR